MVQQMNKRILALAEQAGYGSSRWNTTDQFEQFMEKFSQLIVLEVFDRIDAEKFEVYEPVIQKVKEHFGVKE